MNRLNRLIIRDHESNAPVLSGAANKVIQVVWLPLSAHRALGSAASANALLAPPRLDLSDVPGLTYRKRYIDNFSWLDELELEA
jgi:hypothetical protein